MNGEERARALRLLEMQHQAMLMYTSCGWFFSDISGIETVQNLRYAARAIELAEPFARLDLEAVLLEHLERAPSNVPAHKNGRQIWERQVRPSRVGAEEAVARLLLEGELGREVSSQARFRWHLTPDPIARRDGLLLAGVHALSQVTQESLRFAGACRRDGRFDFLVGIAPWPLSGDWPRFVQEAAAALAPGGSDLTAWAGRHAARLIRLGDFPPDERRAILLEMLADTQRGLMQASEQMCAGALPVAEAMAASAVLLPAWLKAGLEATWSRRLADALEKLDGVTDPGRYADATDLVLQARHLGLSLDLAPASESFGRTLTQRLEAIAGGSEVKAWQDFLELLEIGGRLTLSLPERVLQDRMFEVLRTRIPGLVESLRDPRGETYGLVTAMLAVAARLDLNTEEPRERLRPLEEEFAGDPA
ncbi:MAG: DUF3536 domain-containing protein, partial [Gemmatimonadales bacterium]